MQQPEKASVPRWLQILVGIFLGAFTLLCLVGSVTMIVSPNEQAPILTPILGVIWVLGCFWLLAKCIRLITGRKKKGGLISPRALRIVGLFFLLLPIAGIFTGYFKAHIFVAIVQTAAYVSIFFGLRSLAATREANEHRAALESDEKMQMNSVNKQ